MGNQPGQTRGGGVGNFAMPRDWNTQHGGGGYGGYNPGIGAGQQRPWGGQRGPGGFGPGNFRPTPYTGPKQAPYDPSRPQGPGNWAPTGHPANAFTPPAPGGYSQPGLPQPGGGQPGGGPSDWGGPGSQMHAQDMGTTTRVGNEQRQWEAAPKMSPFGGADWYGSPPPATPPWAGGGAPWAGGADYVDPRIANPMSCGSRYDPQNDPAVQQQQRVPPWAAGPHEGLQDRAMNVSAPPGKGGAGGRRNPFGTRRGPGGPGGPRGPGGSRGPGGRPQMNPYGRLRQRRPGGGMSPGQRQVHQRAMDLRYEDSQRQQDWNKQQGKWLSNTLQQPPGMMQLYGNR